MDSPSPAGASPSTTSRRHSNLSLDLSDIPPLTQPSPPSNTLLITNLQAPEIFTATNLASIHRAIEEHAPVFNFSPLTSLRRIICTFYTADDAVRIRRALDGEAVLGSRVRVYFGADVPTVALPDEEQHLRAPKAQKLFFISPPPSPPMGWESRDEDPPNKTMHPEDLAAALARLDARPVPLEALAAEDGSGGDADPAPSGLRAGRARSATASRIVFDPQDHGHSPDLPAIAVEDTSEAPDDLTPVEGGGNAILHTARPPVELMED